MDQIRNSEAPVFYSLLGSESGVQMYLTLRELLEKAKRIARILSRSVAPSKYGNGKKLSDICLTFVSGDGPGGAKGEGAASRRRRRVDVALSSVTLSTCRNVTGFSRVSRTSDPEISDHSDGGDSRKLKLPSSDEVVTLFLPAGRVTQRYPILHCKMSDGLSN
ncbi:hypothetical protein J6590_059508 [Homalodisca vitripennis]|nr:hypothetical protein J6590_059508 [Homalodisca vitripennis]